MNTPSLTPSEAHHLLSAPPGDAGALRLLAGVPFDDPAAALRHLQRLARDEASREALQTLLPALLPLLAQTANPDRVLVNLERLARALPSRLDFLRTLGENPRAPEILVTLFGGSQFLTEILLRNPEYFERLVQHRTLGEVQRRADFQAKAAAALAPHADADARLDALRRFQRWQLLRIGAADLLGLFDLTAITTQLSHLADSLVQACLAIAAEQTGIAPDGFVVLGMGKLGGEELNYSSDIDLLFLAEGDAPAYERLGRRLIDALTRVTAEGFLYRVDMRLRPWGKMGALVTSVAGHLAYLSQKARLWEKQALLKARIIAGDETVGEDFLRRAEPLLFAPPPERVQNEVRAMKQRIEANLHRQGRKWGEVKLGEGSIRDIEFVVQYLQLAYGDVAPAVRSRNTLDALNRLAEHGFLSPDEHRILTDGYTFLRSVEHWLQMLHYRQTHTLPTDPAELDALARRLGFTDSDAGEQLLARYEQHTIAIRLVYRAHLEPETGRSPGERPATPAYLLKHLARLSPVYATTFSQDDIARHAALAARITPDRPVEVEAHPLDGGRWQVTIVGYDYLGELSLICGLFFAYRLNILEGHVFTYRPAGRTGQNGRPKIVDVFVVAPTTETLPADCWERYAADLTALLKRLEAGEATEAQGELARRLGDLYRRSPSSAAALYPVDIEVDNTSSDRYTVLRIDTVDTLGFLYELTNALALTGVYIARVSIGTAGNHVHDVLHITDTQGRKITHPDKLRELRAATALTKHFTHLLPRSPNPETALLHFRQFLRQLFARPNWPDELVSLEQPRVLEALTRLLGGSDFLWTDFLRMQYANLFPVVRDVDALSAAKSKTQLQAELSAALAAAPDDDARRKALNAFKDREMFRVDMRHIMGYTARFGQFSAELTDVAEVVVSEAYRLSREALLARHGEPHTPDGHPCPMVVCALGKCGGRELGFASDIELLFVYDGSGRTAGAESITTAEFYERLVQGVLRTIQAKREGVFEIDLRLRPYGRTGPLAVPLDSFRRYYAPDGPAWPYERQALVKLRPIAGDAGLGAQLVALRDALVYGGPPFDVAAMRGMRERQIRHLVTPGSINAKFSPGGLVDVEYLVQGLQILHGRDNPYLRLPNTGEAMAALADVGLIPARDFARLREAHIFLRRLINALRMVQGHAKDLTLPPADSDEFDFLARRLHYDDDPSRLREDLLHHMAAVQEIGARLLGG